MTMKMCYRPILFPFIKQSMSVIYLDITFLDTVLYIPIPTNGDCQQQAEFIQLCFHT